MFLSPGSRVQGRGLFNKGGPFAAIGRLIPSARLGTGGVAGGAKFLADDQTFKTVSVTDHGVVSVLHYSTSQTITIPVGATRARVRLFGGTGGGGGYTSNAYGGAGGAGAAALEKYLTGLVAGLTLALTIGAAGTIGTNSSGVGSTDGGDGGTTTLASGTQAISTLTANGGKGGKKGFAGSTIPSLGGTATGGDLNPPGQDASSPAVSSTDAAFVASPGGMSGFGLSKGGQGGGFAPAATIAAGLAGGCTIEWLY